VNAFLLVNRIFSLFFFWVLERVILDFSTSFIFFNLFFGGYIFLAWSWVAAEAGARLIIIVYDFLFFYGTKFPRSGGEFNLRKIINPVVIRLILLLRSIRGFFSIYIRSSENKTAGAWVVYSLSKRATCCPINFIILIRFASLCFMNIGGWVYSEL